MIDKLEFLLALARTRHFGKAAELCHVTQPTLSAGLKQLEGELGVLLVSRGSRFQGFTAEGERVLAYAKTMVADARAMRQEIDGLKRGLVGHLTLSVIPTALSMTAALTTPYRARHPNVTFTILSRTSEEALRDLDELAADAAVTYLDNEPLGKVDTIALYREDYRLLTAADGPLADRDRVTWQEIGSLALCLLTPDMQNRRIIDSLLKRAGVSVAPTLESNSMQVLLAHVRTGRWSSVMPSLLAEMFAVGEKVRSIPLVDPDETHAVGLVTAHRETPTPLVAALQAEARRLALGGIRQ
jgi:DNA-binding transcriptional LysR family regulator